MYRGGLGRAVERLFEEDSDAILQSMNDHLTSPTHEVGLFLLTVFDYETYQGAYRGRIQIEDLDAVASVVRAWVNIGCLGVTSRVFRESGRVEGVAEAIEKLPVLLKGGMTANALDRAWQEGWYTPLYQSLARGTPLNYALDIVGGSLDDR
jgi:hypothetical protein